MKIDSMEGEYKNVAHLFEVINMDTGKTIEYVKSADDETGEFFYYKTDSNGNIVCDVNGPVLLKSIANIKIVYKGEPNE